MHLFPVPPAISEARGGFRYSVYLGLAVALLFACVYLCLTVTMDNTNVGTTNGLWKAPDVSEWEHHTGAPLDSGGFLYMPVYGTLARLIPDGAAQYGAPTPLPTFRKMALLNGVFGGMACGLVFFLALRFTGSTWAGALVALAHGGAGFVVLNSINSEDIVPGYTFLVAALVCFFEFLRSGNAKPYVAAAFFLTLATLFHWTLMAPGLAAFGALFALAMIKERRYFWMGAGWLLLFLCLTQGLVLLCLPKEHIPIWAVVLPGKAQGAGGWVGLTAEKLKYLLIGVGNYFSGAQNSSDYATAFHNGFLQLSMISWAWCVATLAVCAAALFGRWASTSERYLALFALALFAGGEAGALYSQPQDPQMQIEPMLAGVLGMILVARLVLGNGMSPRRIALAALTALIAVNGVWNVHLLSADDGADSRALRQAEELGKLFPKGTTLLVSQGFEGWLTWQSSVVWIDDGKGFQAHNLSLLTEFTFHRGISGAEVAAMNIKRIDGDLAKGWRVVAGCLWQQTPQQFDSSATTVTTLQQAQVLDTLMREHYRVGTRWKTSLGEFDELLKK